MEQFDSKQWEWRMRPQGGEWGEVSVGHGRFQMAQSPVASGCVEVEWRVPGGEWVAAAPHEFGDAACEFLVRISRRHVQGSGDPVVVCAMVHGLPSVWRLDLPPGVYGEGEGGSVVRVRGVSAQFGFGQVLLRVGDFQASGSGVSVMNSEKSQAALLPVAECRMGHLPRTGGFWAVSCGVLPEDEVKQFRKEIESWRR